MRRRNITAAISLFSCGVFVAAPAMAQEESPPARAIASPVEADAARIVPLPQRFEFGASNYSFSFSGSDFFSQANYAGVPAYGAVSATDEIVTLRDVYVSAAVLPDLELTLASWNYAPGTFLYDSGISALSDGPLTAWNGLRSPFSTFGETGFYVGATVGLTDEISLSFGRMSASLGAAADALTTPLPSSVALQLNAQAAAIETTSVGLEWNVTDWAELGVTASRTQDASSVLGDALPSTVRLSAGAETAALGISARVGFGEGWVTTVAYSEGITQLDLNSGTAGFEPLRSQSYGFSVAKQGVFGDDALGITVSQPTGFYGSTNFANLALSSVLNARPDSLTTRESDFTVGYVTTFMDGALALQANTTYRLNANGEQGQDAVSVLSRAQIKF